MCQQTIRSSSRRGGDAAEAHGDAAEGRSAGWLAGPWPGGRVLWWGRVLVTWTPSPLRPAVPTKGARRVPPSAGSGSWGRAVGWLCVPTRTTLCEEERAMGMNPEVRRAQGVTARYWRTEGLEGLLPVPSLMDTGGVGSCQLVCKSEPFL